jgi:cholesterol transport system auxiliary component
MVSAVQAATSLDSTSVWYRLAYSDVQQLRPYAQARWSMPPAELLRQRLREQLGQHRAVLNPLEGVAVVGGAMSLRVELDEFSQLFESASKSTALLRLRATLGRTPASGIGGVGGASGAETLLAQRSFVVQIPCATADAAGGIKALAQAANTVAQELEQWVQQNTPEPAPK